MSRPRLHLLAHANPLAKDLSRLGFTSATDYVDFIRAQAGHFSVTYSPRVFETLEDAEHGGRDDDVLRVRDLQRAINDEKTAAIVALSGGGWFLRILPHVDLSPLAQRREPLWVFGFSEMTSLLNLVSAYRCGRAVYWLCPNYLGWKFESPAERRAMLTAFWRGLADWTNGRKAAENALDETFHSPVEGQVVAGKPRSGAIRIAGGCLSVVASMVGDPRARNLARGRWLALEDIKEAPYRLDRFLAALKLAGWLDRAAGILIGDFHSGANNDQPALLELLRWHVGPKTPVVATNSFGHLWPMTPLRLNQQLEMRVSSGGVRILPRFSTTARSASSNSRGSK